MPESGKKSPAKKRLETLIREGKSLSGYEKNVAFLNLGNTSARFANLSSFSGFDDSGDGRGMAMVDWDGDGDLDVWISNRTGPTIRVLENQLGGRSVAFELVGTQEGCSRDAIGARVEVTVNSRKLVRCLRAGDGFRSQSSKRLHFGLGVDGVISKVVVHWPGGLEEEFPAVEEGGIFRLLQGSGVARKVERQRVWVSGEPLAEAVELSPLVMLENPPSFPKLDFKSLGGGLNPSDTERTLVLLWQPECPLCEKELKAIAENRTRIEESGYRVLALTNAGDAERIELIRRKIASTGFPFEVGLISDSMVEEILVLHRHLFYQPYNLVVPAGFLLDAENRLEGLFRGEMRWDEFVRGSGETRPRFEGSRVRPAMGLRPAVLIKDYLSAGMMRAAERVLRADQDHPTVSGQVSDILRSLGEGHLMQGNFDEALRLLEESAEISPNDARLYNALGVVRLGLKDREGAMVYWRKAVELASDYSAPRLNLGKNLLRGGETGEGMIHLKKFHQYSPEDPDGHNYLAIGYLRQLNYEQAIFHLNALLVLRPSDGDAYLNLAKAYLKMRDRTAARKVLEQGMKQPEVPLESYGKLRELRERLGP